MDNKVLIPVLVGVGILGYVWYKKKQKEYVSAKNPKVAVAEATKVEEKKYSPAFLAQYDIVMPPNQASKAVKEAAEKIQDNRKAREIINRAKKKPVFI
jgi:hypothetical protein